MKKFFLLGLALSLGTLLWTSPSAQAFYLDYAGPEYSNAYADVVIAYRADSGAKVEETSDAIDTGANDVNIGRYQNDLLYMGFDYEFDGFAIDVGTAANNGSYSVEYWDGSNWSTLVSATSASIVNSSGEWTKTWELPGNWTRTTVYMTSSENGGAAYSNSLYFARIHFESDYNTMAVADQLGLLIYNFNLNLGDQLGNGSTGAKDKLSFSASSGADDTVYGSVEGDSAGKYWYALYTPTNSSYSTSLTVPGYVAKSSSTSLDYNGGTWNAVLDFAHLITAYDPTNGNQASIASAKAGTGNTTCKIASGKAYCAVPVGEDNSSATLYANGYAPTSFTLGNRTSDSDAQKSGSVNMAYAYIVTVKDADGYTVGSAKVYMGDDYDITCTYLGGGQYGCVVPTSEDGGELKVSVSGYSTIYATFSTVRASNSDPQVTKTVSLGQSSDNKVDYDVVSIEWRDDGDLVFKIENEGDADTEDDEDVWIYVYVDGDKEWSNSYDQSSSNNFLDAGYSSTFNLGDDILPDEDEEYEVEVCVDATDTVKESDENNNCLKVHLTLGGTGSKGPDLKVTDIYLEDDGDVKFTVKNVGDEDVSNGKEVTIKVYVDGDFAYSKNVTQSSGSTNFLDKGQENTYNAGEILEGEGDIYEVKVCVDTGDAVDESNEDNNCRTEDEDDLAESFDCDFRDIAGHWAENYICALLDREIIDDRSYFYPNEDITRAEFLKMALLNANKDGTSKSGYSYWDVSGSSWYYKYVTYATYKGYVEGYADGSFRPNNDLSRAEAVVILLRVAGEEDWDFDESDIDFYDVERSDWFSYAVVYCEENGIVNGYGDGSFRPEADISRAEAAKIIDKAYDLFYAD